MADEKQNASDEKAASRKANSDNTSPRYAREEHISGAPAMYGVPSHFVAGAFALLYEKGKSGKDGYTKTEVANAIEAFRRHDLTKEN